MHFSATTLLVVLVAVFVAGCRTASSPSDDTPTSTPTDITSGCITSAGEQKPSKTFLLNTIVKMNWYQALAHCYSMGMTLATLDSQQEYDTLVALIRKSRVGAGGEQKDFWLGGSDLGNHGEYIWVSTGQPIIYSNWSPGEPNHDYWNTTVSEMQHCVVLERKWYLMNDYACSYPTYFVCQHHDEKEKH